MRDAAISAAEALQQAARTWESGLDGQLGFDWKSREGTAANEAAMKAALDFESLLRREANAKPQG